MFARYGILSRSTSEALRRKYRGDCRRERRTEIRAFIVRARGGGGGGGRAGGSNMEGRLCQVSRNQRRLRSICFKSNIAQRARPAQDVFAR